MNAYALKIAFMLVLVSAAFPMLQSCSAENTVTWYFRSDYMLKETNTASFNYVMQTAMSSTGYYAGYLGVRVYVDDVELTSGVSAVVSRNTIGSGIQTATLPVPSSLVLGSSVIKVKVYMKLGTSAWTEKAVFTTETLDSVVNGVWTFNYYTEMERTQIGESLFQTDWYFYFGLTVFNSRIEGVSLTEPTVYDWMFYRLRTGNFIGFFTFPFVNLIGNLFYGLIVLLFCMPLYIRYRNLTVILFLITLLGGAGGIAALLIPESGLGLAWLIFVFGLAALIYKVFR